MLNLLAGFIQELRAAGLPVSLTEDLDAMAAVRHVPVEDREAFKYALAATLVKSHGHWRTFETVFEVYFAPPSLRHAARWDDDVAAEVVGDDETAGEREEPGGRGDAIGRDQFDELLHEALLRGDEAAMRALARAAVAHYAGLESGRPMGAGWHRFRVLRHLQLDGVLERLLQAGQHGEGDGRSSLEGLLARHDLEERVDRFRREIDDEIRRRLVAERGSSAVARALRRPPPDQVDFMNASREELRDMSRALEPLARKLAVRLARKRRHRRHGHLDFRNTVRHSLSYGGVPAEPKFRHRRPSKPEIMVLADVSGSVAAFARFTLQLVYAISSQFARVRSFVFIDGIDEVTHLFEASDDVNEALRRVDAEADVVAAEGHSDYGNALETFWERWGTEVDPRTTVIVLGDARNNYHAARAWVVAELRRKARHVYWLNPEPRSYWDTGDSIVAEYAIHCDGVFECRNLRQLERFVEHLG
ncbi:MAG TPA: VWA domain-containing protein [Acidimicrobiales bacterium]|nr:VWA domain-containing protein [Acidimicrobiales bacterium]